ncbi:Zinc finger C2H2 [Penicillium maclennaniae]|uniref:Zinc finger C2H2 n=1 Tax=Penicillium maclennaniae TaxID=1343394 RepID=UPI0025407C24|nr:Zinc finger C2H2 [Penicillium maclennaniae]KAJ5677400.1 Zinc finger C2H2 [Penicillium maclennaniae]
MSTPSGQSPTLHELKIDPYLSAPSDPEESDFHASAIRLTAAGGSPNHSSPNGSRRPSVQSQTHLFRGNGHMPSKPISYLAPSDIELVNGSDTWQTEATSSFNSGPKAPEGNMRWVSGVDVNTSQWLSTDNAMPSPTSTSGSLTVPSSAATMRESFARSQPGLGISNSTCVLPELTISTNYQLEDDLISPSTRGRSPIVTVSKVSRGDSPVVHQRRPSRSTAHLSPGDMSSESGHEDDLSDVRSVGSLSVARTHNGKWIPNSTTGHRGLDPVYRGDELVPSPNDLQDQRERDKKNESISIWTESVSEASNGVADEPPLSRLKSPATRTRRARSTGDRPFQQEDYFNLQFTSTNRPVLGPGVKVYESSEDEASEASNENESIRAESPVADATQIDQNDCRTPEICDSLEQTDSRGNFCLYPWQDIPCDSTPRTEVMQPGTSSAAMVAFEKRARDLETASLTATIDNNSIINFGMTFDRLSIKDQPKTKERRSNSLLRRPFFQQASSKLKRQASDLSISTAHTAAQPSPQEPRRKDSGSHRHRLSLSSRSPRSHKHTRSPSLTNALMSMSGQMAAIGGSHSVRAVSPNPEASPVNVPKNRVRSRSEVPRPVTPGLMDLMTTHGGPPVAGLYRSPMPEMGPEPRSAAPRPNTAGAEVEDEIDMIDGRSYVMDFPPVSSLPVPTFEGFRAQIMQLNPQLEPALIHRFAQAQVRRYRNLVELQQKHLVAVANRSCKAGKFCFALGGEAFWPPHRPADTEAGRTHFRVADHSTSHSRDQPYILGEGAIAAAHFPPGVPLPPVDRLPAEFECPICFEVKKFHKPSDWSKHVHEDTQPFTCSFPECNEPKSFKRKADWVRHENERHRQLEWWTCSNFECHHTCYRKDNFVQHLVREHKMPDPKAKKTKGSADAGDGLSDSMREQELSRLWKIVDECHHETENTLRHEPCRFCGNICGSWKKLTVHLGKHMEQLAMPVLELAKQSCAAPPNLAHQVGKAGRSTETQAPLAAQTPVHAQHDCSGTPAHLARPQPPPQCPTSNARTPARHPFSYEIPLLNYPSISGGELSMEPESITESVQPGDPQFAGAGYMNHFDQGALHAQAQTHPLHQNSVTYPPPYNAVPRSRTPEANAAMLPHSYSLSSHLQGSLYPATGYPAYQPVAPNPHTPRGPMTPATPAIPLRCD